jgi:hypothetical protein
MHKYVQSPIHFLDIYRHMYVLDALTHLPSKNTLNIYAGDRGRILISTLGAIFDSRGELCPLGPGEFCPLGPGGELCPLGVKLSPGG